MSMVGGQKDHEVFILTQPDVISDNRILFLVPNYNIKKERRSGELRSPFVKSLMDFYGRLGNSLPRR